MSEITLVGTGAMALYFGGRLAAAGESVQFLGTWKEGIEAINRDGIRIEDRGQEAVFPARGSFDLSGEGPIKTALVLVKSWQTDRAAKQLAGLLAPDGIALTMQNGLGNAELLQKYLGEERTAQAVTTYGATLLGPGRVRSGGEGIITLQQHPGAAGLAQAFRKSGLRVQETADLSSLVWGKLVINVGINPLSALLEVENGRLLESPAAVELISQAARETADVARELGIELEYADPAESVLAVAAATAENVSSMLQDMRRGALTEIDAMCGAVIRCGKKVGRPTPINELLALLVKSKVELRKGSQA